MSANNPMAIQVPKFATETEEADWWQANRALVEQEFVLATKEGRLRRRPPSEPSPERHPSYGLSAKQILQANEIAQKRGMTLSDYLVSLVHQGLERDAA